MAAPTIFLRDHRRCQRPNRALLQRQNLPSKRDKMLSRTFMVAFVQTFAEERTEHDQIYQKFAVPAERASIRAHLTQTSLILPVFADYVSAKARGRLVVNWAVAAGFPCSRQYNINGHA